MRNNVREGAWIRFIRKCGLVRLVYETTRRYNHSVDVNADSRQLVGIDKLLCIYTRDVHKLSPQNILCTCQNIKWHAGFLWQAILHIK